MEIAAAPLASLPARGERRGAGSAGGAAERRARAPPTAAGCDVRGRKYERKRLPVRAWGAGGGRDEGGGPRCGAVGGAMGRGEGLWGCRGPGLAVGRGCGRGYGAVGGAVGGAMGLWVGLWGYGRGCALGYGAWD